jgi:PhzF family phenazine biosynthesis protein
MSHPEGIPVWQVDAFADAPFTGNPAAVCLLDEYPSDAWLQSVASEMNLSETAFVVPDAEPDNFRLRWFTPVAEVDLCGHATLASAHALLEHQVVRGERIRFQTRSGELVCEQREERITLDFPATPIVEEVADRLADEVRLSLGIDSAEVLRSKFDLVVIVDRAETVRSLQPDFDRIKRLSTRGVMVTAKSNDDRFDFVSRFFAPLHQIDEDPVTGSAHCCLATYWAEQLGNRKLVGYQASQRGGTVHCEVEGARVRLSGTAVTIFEGRLRVSPQEA